MRLRLLRAAQMRTFLTDIATNLDRYRNGDFDFLKTDPSLFIETSHEIDAELLAAIDCAKDDDRETENCMTLYLAMGGLFHYLARDERLW